MRFCSYRTRSGGIAVGRVENGRVVPLANRSLVDIIGGDPPREATGAGRPLEGVELVPPFVPPAMIGVGLNYRDHAAETGKSLPPEPLLFAKLPSAIAPPVGEVRIPDYTDELDYEGELAVVIGPTARAVGPERALEHIFGYAAMNDISARDRQRAEPQWIRAKGGDGFAPFGPVLTTADEVPDPQCLAIRTWVNDELRQDGNTADMHVSVARLVSWCSYQFTLLPGTVITTGTPAGVGAGFDPPRYLREGDRVVVEVERLGRLEQRVVGHPDE